MLDKAGRLHIVRMGNDEFFVLRGGCHICIEFANAKRTITKRHRHGFAFTLPEHQTIAAGELWCLLGRAFELAHHLAFGQLNTAKRNGKAELGHIELNLHLTNADLTDKWMRVAITALRGIPQRQQEAFITTRQSLQAQIARHRKRPRFAGKIARLMPIRHCTIFFDHPVDTENIGHAWRLFRLSRTHFRLRNADITRQFRIKQTMRIIECRSQ